MNTLHLNGMAWELPGSVEEMDGQTYKRYCRALYSPGLSTKKRIRIFLALVSPVWHWKRWYLFWKVKAHHLEAENALQQFTAFAETEAGPSKQVWPELRLKGWKYYGPGDYLKNVTFYELIKTQTYFNNWKSSQGTEHLDKLCATLYRAERKGYHPVAHADRREPLADHTVAKRAALWSGQPPWKKLGIAAYTEACFRKMASDPAFSEVFTPPKKTPKGKSFGMLGVLDDLARHPENLEKVGQLDWQLALFHLNKSLVRQDEQELEQSRKR